MHATPARRKKAREAMGIAQDVLIEMVRQLGEEGLLESHPEIAALADEARAAAHALHKARTAL